jgi:hypothetical protein
MDEVLGKRNERERERQKNAEGIGFFPFTVSVVRVVWRGGFRREEASRGPGRNRILTTE